MKVMELGRKHRNDWIIYAAICDRQMFYVGRTIHPYERMAAHRHIHKHKNTKDISYFHRALKCYGIDNFEWICLYVCKNKDEGELNRAEGKFIKWCNSLVPGGYNLTTGGEGHVHAADSKSRRTGKDHHSHVSNLTPEQRKNISESNRETWKNKPEEEKKEHARNVSEGRKNMTQEQKKEAARKSSESYKKTYANMPEEKKKELNKKNSESNKKRYANMTDAEKKELNKKQSEGWKRGKQKRSEEFYRIWKQLI